MVSRGRFSGGLRSIGLILWTASCLAPTMVFFETVRGAIPFVWGDLGGVRRCSISRAAQSVPDSCSAIGGGQTWATIATLLLTCRMNAVDPAAWRIKTLERIANQGRNAKIDAPCHGPVAPERPRRPRALAILKRRHAPREPASLGCIVYPLRVTKRVSR